MSLSEDGQHIDYSLKKTEYKDYGLSDDLCKMIGDAVAHKNLKESISDLYSDLSE